MDFMIFLVFAISTNYCFIGGCGCRSKLKETSVSINVHNDIDGQSKTPKSVDLSDSNSNLNPAYQAPVVYPYSYPVPEVYYPVSNPVNVQYERGAEIFQTQNTQYIETLPAVPSVSTHIENQPVIPVPPSVVSTHFVSQPVISVPPSVGVHTESYPGPYQPVNRPTFIQEPNLQPVLANPLAIPAEPAKRQDFFVPVSRPTQSDSNYYQPTYGRPPTPPSFPPQYNPCQNKQCRPGSKCVARRTSNCPRCELIAVCVDPCETVRCASGYICKAEVGHCGTPFCEPRAVCKDPCQGITCPGYDNCTLISLPCTTQTSCDPVPICGRDPCETMRCPLGQGCYLQEHFCSRPPCKVEAVCRDPCRDVTCAPGEFCYTEDVTCIKAPCNPIPYCKNPCQSLSCPVGQHCELEQAFCIRSPCNPIATCKPN